MSDQPNGGKRNGGKRAGGIRQRIEVWGVVQGVGFRPFVFTLANRLGLTGFVLNHSSGVTIEVQGAEKCVVEFLQGLRSQHPPLARLDSMSRSRLADRPEEQAFVIQASESTVFQSTPISPDVATCEPCLAEMNDPHNRRYRYPFINCTHCGPRFTIIRDIPYDRPNTTMAEFSMCRRCRDEYADPGHRRFHAQPNACPACGPRVWYLELKQAADPALLLRNDACPAAHDAIFAFHDAVARQQIVAVKGIGGFHLACNAASNPAIESLRERKGRVDKPFAVMVRDMQQARACAHVNVEEERLLTNNQRPIVLLQRRPGSPLSDLVAPGNDFVGVMLPYSPLHQLLLERGPLVMTSANLSDEPIVRTNQEAADRLADLADGLLLHDREIHVVCDDSVTRVFRGHELPIRRSRGYAPLPIRLRADADQLLAVGGQLKSTVCLTKGSYAYLSQHIGDMENLETFQAFQRTVDHMSRLFRVVPQAIACDLHPDYLSTRWAEQFARRHALPLIAVQHHHAHLASVLAELGNSPDRTVIGISMDGTGYGPDGAIWGGEFMRVSCHDYQRLAHLRYVSLPGGDTSIKHPHRMALAHLWAAGVPWSAGLPCVAHCAEPDRRLLLRQLERNLNCVRTSSMGRLFDAVAALIGIRQSVTYEAQAAMEMEALSDPLERSAPYAFPVIDDPDSSAGYCRVLDPTQLIQEVSRDVLAGVPLGTIVARFHSSVVQVIVDLCQLIRREEDLHTVALSGGVFQNQLLLRHAVERLEQRDFAVLFHRLVPPNDGGLALGQAIIAARKTSGQLGSRQRDHS